MVRVCVDVMLTRNDGVDNVKVMSLKGLMEQLL